MAIIGASERASSIGNVLLRNMLAADYRGKLFAVNPRHRSVGGVACYGAIDQLPERADLAVIATPPHTVPGIIEQCGRAGVPAALVITAGFAETGPQGAVLEQAILANARSHGIRVMGPNCLGIMRPGIGLNATFARNAARAGSLGLVSQSGAVCTALLDWATPNNIGFSSIVSLGGSTDVDFGEIIDYLVCDPATEHILLYIEGVRNARRFVGALRAAARVKPVILMKVGRYPAGSRAAKSHTGAMVGSDDVFDAVVRRTGVVRVKTIGQLVAAAQALAAHVRPRGERLAVVTNGGGPGVMAADRASEVGLPLAVLSAQTIATLQNALPENWSQGNPLDLIGDAGAERYRAAVSACLADANVDGALVILTPQAMTDPTAVARVVVDEARLSTKPLLACWMGEASVHDARLTFAQAQIPTFSTPEPAIDMFAHISSFYRNQRALLETPGPLEQQKLPDIAAANKVMETALSQDRSVLSEIESKAVLAAFHIPVATVMTARSADEAVLHAGKIGYPVVLKIDSPDISHKSDVGGVLLNVPDAQAVHAAFAQINANAALARPDAHIIGVSVEPMLMRKNARETMVGMIRDPVFGPAITFGAGGTAVEIIGDRAVGLPPLNAYLISDMIRRTRISRMLGAFRNLSAVDMPALESVILRVSEMACELPWMDELDINPLVIDETGAVALDARVVIRKSPLTQPKYGHLAIPPYPAHLATRCTLSNGVELTLRPIRPEDAAIEQAFVRQLSPQSRYFRFMGSLRELTPSMLARFTQIDYDREMAFIAVHTGDAQEEEVAVARYITNPDDSTCEFALVVADAWRQFGIAKRLMSLLIKVARERRLHTMIGHILATNAPMLALCAQLGFQITDVAGDMSSKCASLVLPATP